MSSPNRDSSHDSHEVMNRARIARSVPFPPGPATNCIATPLISKILAEEEHDDHPVHRAQGFPAAPRHVRKPVGNQAPLLVRLVRLVRRRGMVPLRRQDPRRAAACLVRQMSIRENPTPSNDDPALSFTAVTARALAYVLNDIPAEVCHELRRLDAS